MGKISKEMQWRIEGEIFALNVGRNAAKEAGEPYGVGIEAIERDIRTRGFLQAPMKFSNKQIDEFIEYLSLNLYETMLTVTLMTLHDEFGFAKTRLERFKKRFDEKTAATTDFSYLGNHYATLEDYAIYLKKEFGFELDIEKIAVCQENYCTEELLKGKADVKELVNQLRENNFTDAAEWLAEKIS